jgi:hypothetical protein
MTTASAPTRFDGWESECWLAYLPDESEISFTRQPSGAPRWKKMSTRTWSTASSRATLSLSFQMHALPGWGGRRHPRTLNGLPSTNTNAGYVVGVNLSQSSRWEQTDGNACSCRTGASRLESSAKRRTAAPQTAGGGTGTRCTTWGPVAGGTRRPPPSPHV